MIHSIRRRAALIAAGPRLCRASAAGPRPRQRDARGRHGRRAARPASRSASAAARSRRSPNARRRRRQASAGSTSKGRYLLPGPDRRACAHRVARRGAARAAVRRHDGARAGRHLPAGDRHAGPRPAGPRARARAAGLAGPHPAEAGPRVLHGVPAVRRRDRWRAARPRPHCRGDARADREGRGRHQGRRQRARGARRTPIRAGRS